MINELIKKTFQQVASKVHTHTQGKRMIVRSSCICRVPQPRLWPHFTLVLYKVISLGQVLTGVLINALQPWRGNQCLTCVLEEYGTASGFDPPQPKLGSQFTVLLGPGWSAKWMHIHTHTHTQYISLFL